MSGVAGILNFDASRPSPDAVIAMTRVLAHRGPDDWGVRIDGPCGLGHRRLAIIDKSNAGAQPMGSADGRMWITFDGRIYNYLELKAELTELGFEFRSKSDTEVVLHAYRAWGRSAFERFNGMWALGLWDADRAELVLSRDRFGIKPLCLHKGTTRLLFASEVKALIAVEPRLASIDRGRLASFLTQPVLGPVPATFFEGVESVEPASIVTIDAQGELRRDRYWTFRPPTRRPQVDAEEAAGRVRELVVDAVKLRFRAHVPVGTCLTGGLDSSVIAGVASKILGESPATFSALHPDPKYDERPFVDIMLGELDLSSHEVSPSGDDFIDVVRSSIYHHEQPSVSPDGYALWHVAQAASGEVGVLLDGHGADEVFGGHQSYLLSYYQSLLGLAARGDVSAVARVLSARAEIEALIGEDPLRTIFQGGVDRTRAKYWSPLRNFAIRGLRARLDPQSGLRDALRVVRRAVEKPTIPAVNLLSAELLKRFGGPATERPVVTGDPFVDHMWDSLVRTIIPAALHSLDRNATAHGVEIRTPYLDHRLVEYVYQLPSWLKIDGSRMKAVLRDSMVGILPESIRDRRSDQKGYHTPISEWIRERHTEWARDLVLSERTRQRELTDQDGVERLMREHLDQQADHGLRLFGLMTLELFLRRYVDGGFVPDAAPVGAAREDPRDSTRSFVS